jgi:myo-inositol 2-dehydrogenase/D-chiro-inositol 1-dehydrogenase
VRVGFIGAGAVTRYHLSVLERRDDVEIAVVCDIDEARAAAIAAGVGAAVTARADEAIATPGLDAVFVCTPPAHHVGPTVAALERGVAVYLEKPLARSLADGRTIVEAAAKSPAVCNVGYQWRSLDVLASLRAALGDAVPGLLISRSLGSTDGGRSDVADAAAGGSWFTDARRSGGILFELGSHDIDLQCAIAGPVAAVQASSGRGHMALAGTPADDLDDAVLVTLRFASGALGSVAVGWTDAQTPPLYTLDVLGTDHALHLELDPHHRLEGRAHGAPVSAQGAVDPRTSTLDRFLEAVEQGDREGVVCSPADAYGTLAALIACEQSLASGAVVPVETL